MIDVFVFVSYSLGIGLVRCNTSAVHLHSFRFAGGILTAAVPPFSENVDFITLSIRLISYLREIISLMLYGFNHGLISC